MSKKDKRRKKKLAEQAAVVAAAAAAAAAPANPLMMNRRPRRHRATPATGRAAAIRQWHHDEDGRPHGTCGRRSDLVRPTSDDRPVIFHADHLPLRPPLTMPGVSPKRAAQPLAGMCYGPANTCAVDTFLTLMQHALRPSERALLKALDAFASATDRRGPTSQDGGSCSQDSMQSSCETSVTAAAAVGGGGDDTGTAPLAQQAQQTQRTPASANIRALLRALKALRGAADDVRPGAGARRRLAAAHVTAKEEWYGYLCAHQRELAAAAALADDDDEVVCMGEGAGGGGGSSGSVSAVCRGRGCDRASKRDEERSTQPLCLHCRCCCRCDLCSAGLCVQCDRCACNEPWLIGCITLPASHPASDTSERGMLMACSWHAHGMLVACPWRARGVLVACAGTASA